MKENKNIDNTEELIKCLSQLFEDSENLPEGNIKESINKIIDRKEEIVKKKRIKW